MYRCGSCGCGYLDPCPDKATIGLAYSSYYTHGSQQRAAPIRRIGLARTLLHDWLNGYLNSRYGLSRRPANTGGRLLLPLLPPIRTAADAYCRHLRRPPPGGFLLDLGCGNGEFLSLAQEMGWRAEGVDFDEQAVRAARDAGFQVHHGGIEVFEGVEERYDVITLNHVIEHVHDPVELLGRVHSLLKPGGVLWIETPNVESLGHRIYGPHWRGLEPPRHLVLFSSASLRSALQRTGFSRVSQKFRGLALYSVFAASEAIADGGNVSVASRSGRPKVFDMLAEGYEMLVPRHREFLTYIAQKGA